MNKHYYLYEIKNLVNNKIYIGVHETYNLNDHYFGSGKILAQAISKYGKHNFTKRILCFTRDRDQAYEIEALIIDEKFVKDSNTYNIKKGGLGGLGWEHTRGKTVVKDKDGTNIMISINDPRYLSGELVGINVNMVNVIDEHGTAIQISKDDPRYLSGELVGVTKGLAMYKDKDGNTYQTSKDDPRVVSGKLVGINKGNSVIGTNLSKRIICPHCNKEGNVGNMKRWHFDNCKFITSTNIST